MRHAEDALGTMTVWLGFGGTALISVVLVTQVFLERAFNPGGTIFLCAMTITYLGLRYFALRHHAERSFASLI